MPADHLTTVDPLADAVLHVLAGRPLADAATAAGTDPADLADAVDAYHHAGLVALRRRSPDAWYHVRVCFPDWNTAEHMVIDHIAPALAALHADGAAGPWWFLRKHPHWRLRIHTTDPVPVAGLLDTLTGTGVIGGWQPGIYEPENVAFGNRHGMTIAHDLFCADSHGVLTYLREPHPGLGRREISLLLIAGLLHAAGLDTFERGDVFANVARHRPASDTDDPRLNELTRHVRGLLSLPVTLDSPLFRDGGACAHATGWLAAHITAGHRLRHAADDHHLDRGLRQIITHIVIFGWNRLNLSAQTQNILARAATEAFLPKDRP